MKISRYSEALNSNFQTSLVEIKKRVDNEEKKENENKLILAPFYIQNEKFICGERSENPG